MIPATGSPGDAGVRQRGLDSARSFIVQAPAGSGKTELLIQRFLGLLATVDEPEQVVAITFTRKAASEMRDRVFAALELSLRPSEACELSAHGARTRQLARDVLERDSQAGWRLLEQPNRLRIQTIDALSSSYARMMPWLARFGAMPEPVDDAEPLYRAAAIRALHALGDPSQPEASAAVAALLTHLENQVDRAEKLVAQMLGWREQWLPYVLADPAELRPALETNLAGVLAHELRRLHELAPAAVWELRPVRPATVQEWQELAGLLLTTNGDWRKKTPPEFKHRSRVFEMVMQQLNRDSTAAFRRALRYVRDLPSPRYDDSQWALLESLFHVLRQAAGHLRVVFQTRRQVDFTEISMSALQALGPIGEPTDLALASGHRVRHLLVDEFQDTSGLQQQLLLRITGGWSGEVESRTVFFVGDPMQSIYRFRHAEVAHFLEVRNRGFGEIADVEPLQLAANFRSAPALVEWVNRVFPAILPEDEDSNTGTVPFAPSDAFRDAGAFDEAVSFTIYDESADEAEASLVADLALESLGRDEDSKTAVLVRARPHLEAILREFKRRGMRYRAVQVTTLAESAVVRDLLALARALVHFADRPAWLAVLRAPWCGLTLADLHAVAGTDLKATIWSQLESPAVTLSEDGSRRLRRLLTALEPVMRQRLRIPVRDLVEAAWLRLGGPACLHSEAEREDAAGVFSLLEEFDVAGDLPDFDRIEQRLYNLFTAPDPAADERLQLMTIHQAKGLEFDTVIIPGAGKPPKTADPRLLSLSRVAGQVVIAPIPSPAATDPIYKFLERQERMKDEQESARLLYVAATRAREKLHVIGHVRLTKDGPRPVAGSFLQMLWPIASATPLVRAQQAVSTRTRPPIERLPLDWLPEAGRPDVTFEAPAEPLREVTFDWVGSTLRSIGVVVHRMVQRMAREGPSVWTQERVGAEEPAIRAALASEGVPVGEVAAGAKRVVAALVGMLEDPVGRWTLESHSGAASELALTASLKSGIVRVVVDRTFVDETGTRWIIDYKTSSHEGSDVDAFLDNEVLRYTGQLELYARVMRIADDSRPVKLGLYFPLLRAWRVVSSLNYPETI